MVVESSPDSATKRVAPGEFDATLARLCASGRCRVRLSAHEIAPMPVHWDGEHPWRLELRVESVEGGHELTGYIARAGEIVELARPAVIHRAGLLYMGSTLARFDHGGAFE